MEANKIGENGGRREIEGSDAKKENEEVDLKNIIASHPLYEVLIDSHIKCLKVTSYISCFLISLNLLLLTSFVLDLY